MTVIGAYWSLIRRNLQMEDSAIIMRTMRDDIYAEIQDMLNGNATTDECADSLNLMLQSALNDSNGKALSPPLCSTVFECDNCGHKPSAKEVLENDGQCTKCKTDNIIAYVIDAAEAIVALQPST